MQFTFLGNKTLLTSAFAASRFGHIVGASATKLAQWLRVLSDADLRTDYSGV